MLGHDGFLPRQFSRRGDRLVFSNGIVILAALAGAADLGLRRQHHPADPALHHRRVRLLHPQPGRAWSCTGPAGCATGAAGTRWRAGRCAGPGRSTLVGAVFTGVVLVVVLITKFTHGAWIVVLAMPALVPADEGHPPALRSRRRGPAAESGRRHAAGPHPRRRAGVQAAHAHPAGAGLRPGHPPDHAHRADRVQSIRRGRALCCASGPSGASPCR